MLIILQAKARNTVAENGKVVVNGNVLTLTFENVKDSLKKDTQYTVTFPTLDYNDADKLGMTASVHYAPADETTTIALETKDKVTVDGADYYVATLEKPSLIIHLLSMVLLLHLLL